MAKDYKLIQKINNSIISRLSAKGEGLTVTIPKEICSTYNIIAGDRVKITLTEHYRKNVEEETEKELAT